MTQQDAAGDAAELATGSPDDGGRHGSAGPIAAGGSQRGSGPGVAMAPHPPAAPGGPPLSPREVAPYFEPTEVLPEYAHLHSSLGRHLTRLKVPFLAS